MRITCPQCGFFRELPDHKVPVTTSMATCPKCRHRFKFRRDETPATADLGFSAKSADENLSSWRRQGANPVPLHRQPPPTAHWEPQDDPSETSHQPSAEPQTAPTRSYEAPVSPRAGHHDLSEKPVAPAQEPDAPASPASFTPRPDPRDEPPLRPDSPEAEEDAVYRPRRTVAPRRPVEEEQSETDFGPVEQPEPPVRQPEPQVRQAEAPPWQPEPDEATPAAPVAPTTPREPEIPASSPQAKDEPGPSAPEKGRIQPDGVRDIWARLQAMDDKPGRKHTAKDQAPQLEDEAEPEPERELIADPIPWERQESYGFFPGLFLTLKKVLFQPVEFFEEMPTGRPKSKALVFNLLISEFLLLIDFLWTLMGLRGKLGPDGQANTLLAFAGSPNLSFLAALLLVPIILSVGIYLDAWLTHLLLILFRSAKKGFNETFRVMCYSAAPTVLSAVPVAGQILSPVILIWYMALQAIGLKKVHEAAYTQTLAAIFIKWSIYLFLLLAMLQSISPAH